MLYTLENPNICSGLNENHVLLNATGIDFNDVYAGPLDTIIRHNGTIFGYNGTIVGADGAILHYNATHISYKNETARVLVSHYYVRLAFASLYIWRDREANERKGPCENSIRSTLVVRFQTNFLSKGVTWNVTWLGWVLVLDCSRGEGWG